MRMSKPMLVVLAALALAVVAALGAGGAAYFHPLAPPSPGTPAPLSPTTTPPTSVTPATSPAEGNPATLLEAWEALSAYAAAWRADAVLAELRSLDAATEAHPIQAGWDGRRAAWGARFVSEGEPPLQLWARLVDGVVVEAIEQPHAGEPVSPLGRPLVDSPEALALVEDKVPAFAPAGELSKGRGVHFAATAGAGLAVIGQGDGVPLTIQVDTATRQIVEAKEHTVAALGGVMYSADGGRTWQASDLVGAFVARVAPDPVTPTGAYASVPGRRSVALHHSADGGATWREVGMLPPEAGNWAFDLLVLGEPGAAPTVLVGTRVGLWASADGGRAWWRVEGLPFAPVQWLGAARSGAASRLFATVSVGAEAGLYSSVDLKEWVKVDDAVYRLSGSVDGAIVLGMNEAPGGQPAWVWAADAPARPLSVPAGALRAAGVADGSGALLAQTPAAVLRSTDGGGSWQATLEAGLASLAVAPGFAEQGLALAGGFRGGIYRSDDGGRTWSEVLARPSAVVPGSGTVPGVLFLTDSRAIAISEGRLEWQSR